MNESKTSIPYLTLTIDLKDFVIFILIVYIALISFMVIVILKNVNDVNLQDSDDEDSIFLNLLNEKRVNVVRQLINPCKINAFKQSFAFPKPLMDRITRQPTSSETWIKLIQTCKHFFGVNPILVVKRLEANTNKKWLIVNLNYQKLKLHIVDFEAYKIWIMDSFQIYNYSSVKMVSHLVPHIYKCELQRLDIHDQELSFEEFQFLMEEKTIRECKLNNSVVTYSDGKVVPLEVILKAVPTVYSFTLDNTYKFFTPETSKNLLRLPKLKNFKRIMLLEPRDSLDPKSLVQFIKNQKLQHTDLYFCESMSLDYIETFVAVLKKTAQKQKIESRTKCYLSVYHDDNPIFYHCFKMTFRTLLLSYPPLSWIQPLFYGRH